MKKVLSLMFLGVSWLCLDVHSVGFAKDISEMARRSAKNFAQNEQNFFKKKKNFHVLKKNNNDFDVLETLNETEETSNFSNRVRELASYENDLEEFALIGNNSQDNDGFEWVVDHEASADNARFLDEDYIWKNVHDYKAYLAMLPKATLADKVKRFVSLSTHVSAALMVLLPECRTIEKAMDSLIEGNNSWKARGHKMVDKLDVKLNNASIVLKEKGREVTKKVMKALTPEKKKSSWFSWSW